MGFDILALVAIVLLAPFALYGAWALWTRQRGPIAPVHDAPGVGEDLHQALHRVVGEMSIPRCRLNLRMTEKLPAGVPLRPARASIWLPGYRSVPVRMSLFAATAAI